MKSLQEIWDRIEIQQAAIEQNQQLNSLLFAAVGVDLPWQTTTVDSIGSVGLHTSLAFGPSGQPAISYHEEHVGNLKFARKTLFAPNK